MLIGSQRQPVSLRTSLVTFVGPGVGVTVIPPRTPQAAAAENWFTRPKQFCCIKYVRVGFFNTQAPGARVFVITFTDTATALSTFVTRLPTYVPAAAGIYTETSFSGGMGIRDVIGGVGTFYNTWPAEGVYFKQGDSITVSDPQLGYADDFIFLNFTFELFN